jgi:hypothetical protein
VGCGEKGNEGEGEGGPGKENGRRAGPAAEIRPNGTAGL